MSPTVVSWTFLAVTLVGGAFTLNAVRPAPTFWLLQVPGFFASWLTGELAAHHLFWQAVATAWFVHAGALSAWPGLAGLAVTFFSWAGLLWILRVSRNARYVGLRALRDGLGESYLDEIEPDLRAPIEDAWSIRQRLLPLPIRDVRVERIRNVEFARHGGVRLRLDIYRSRRRPERCPVLLHVHGGAWVIGRKDEQGLPLMLRMAAHGWLCVSANYRLSPRATWPDHIVDVKAAIHWIREHVRQHGGDPDFIAISGGSAGGHLAALAALTWDESAWQPGFERADTRVQACVPFYGVYDWTNREGHWGSSLLLPMLERAVVKRSRVDAPEVFDRASPSARVRADAPPFLVVHGSHDSLVPVADARAFVRHLRRVSEQPVAYAELPGAQHAFEIFPSERTLHALRTTEAFLGWVLSRHRARRRLADAAE